MISFVGETDCWVLQVFDVLLSWYWYDISGDL